MKDKITEFEYISNHSIFSEAQKYAYKFCPGYNFVFFGVWAVLQGIIFLFFFLSASFDVLAFIFLSIFFGFLVFILRKYIFYPVMITSHSWPTDTKTKLELFSNEIKCQESWPDKFIDNTENRDDRSFLIDDIKKIFLSEKGAFLIFMFDVVFIPGDEDTVFLNNLFQNKGVKQKIIR